MCNNDSVLGNHSSPPEILLQNVTSDLRNKCRELKKLTVGTDHRDALLALTLSSPLHDLVIWLLRHWILVADQSAGLLTDIHRPPCMEHKECYNLTSP
jgi:hypothetical protein